MEADGGAPPAEVGVSGLGSGESYRRGVGRVGCGTQPKFEAKEEIGTSKEQDNLGGGSG